MVLRGLTMHETAVYRIRFQGAVDDSWKQHLDAGWTIQYANSIPETMTITGIMRDQAALIGLLSSLYEVGLPLLDVEWLGAEASQPRGHESLG